MRERACEANISEAIGKIVQSEVVPDSGVTQINQPDGGDPAAVDRTRFEYLRQFGSAFDLQMASPLGRDDAMIFGEVQRGLALLIPTIILGFQRVGEVEDIAWRILGDVAIAGSGPQPDPIPKAHQPPNPS